MEVHSVLVIHLLRSHSFFRGYLRLGHAGPQLENPMFRTSFVPFRWRFGSISRWQYRGWSVCRLSSLSLALSSSFLHESSLGSTYEAANFRMSTWTPMIWAGILTMVLTLAGFPIQGGL